jgi:uncharacterized protein
MFPKMRRAKQELPKDEAFKMLSQNGVGVLSLNTVDGYPYGVPLDYILIDDCLYFHGATSGFKFDCINKNPKASFSVISESKVDPKTYSNYYKSVICFGLVTLIKDDKKKQEILEKFTANLNSDLKSNKDYIDKYFKVTAVFEFKIEHITAKVASSFIKK